MPFCVLPLCEMFFLRVGSLRDTFLRVNSVRNASVRDAFLRVGSLRDASLRVAF